MEKKVIAARSSVEIGNLLQEAILEGFRIDEKYPLTIFGNLFECGVVKGVEDVAEAPVADFEEVIPADSNEEELDDAESPVKKKAGRPSKK